MEPQNPNDISSMIDEHIDAERYDKSRNNEFLDCEETLINELIKNEPE